MILIQETDNTSDVNIGHVSDNVNKLNITFLNVCGIKSKLLNPNFDLLIKSYDVLIFTETNTDEFDELTEEYTYFAKHRKKIHKKSGGIIVVFKNTLSKCLHFIKSDSEYRGGSRISSYGGALKKIAPSGGRRDNFGGISCEKSRFYAKKSYFFQLPREARIFLRYFV